MSMVSYSDLLILAVEAWVRGMSIRSICVLGIGIVSTPSSLRTSFGNSYSRFAVDSGYLPIAPHLLFPQFMDDGNPKERELAMFFGNVLMSKCAELWVFGDLISNGRHLGVSPSVP